MKAGPASHTIALPKKWVEKNNLQKGDTLYVLEKSDTELSITPEMVEQKPLQKEITIKVDGKESGAIQREITSAYINNYSSIVLVGETLSKKAKELREILHHFVALEIAEQTSAKIVAKDLLNLKETSVDKTIRRMDMIIRSIVQDVRKQPGKVQESIEQRDNDINRLYFLMFRLLKGTLTNKQLATELAITSADALSLWYITLSMENIADNLRALGIVVKRSRQDCQHILEGIETAFVDVMKAYYNNDKKLADGVTSRRITIFDEAQAMLKNNCTPETAELAESLRRITTQICNIARAVIDRE